MGKESVVDAVYEAIMQVRRRGEEAVLVTVVDAQGATPARLGAKMIVRARDDRVGTIAGGALERAAIAKACELGASRQCGLVRYTLTADDRAIEGEASGVRSVAQVTLFFDVVGHSHH